MSNPRPALPAATQAALWALSNGNCYAPGCPFPVVHEVRPGVYKKNAQIAHIYGVKGPRKNSKLLPEQRDQFQNLILLCLAHHAEVDDKNYGERLYPAEKLFEWKDAREGKRGPALDGIIVRDEDELFTYLAAIFEPPIERLEAIASQLEETGALNADSVAELQEVIRVMVSSDGHFNTRGITKLGDAADQLRALELDKIANKLLNAADQLGALRRR